MKLTILTDTKHRAAAFATAELLVDRLGCIGDGAVAVRMGIRLTGVNCSMVSSHSPLHTCQSKWASVIMPSIAGSNVAGH